MPIRVRRREHDRAAPEQDRRPPARGGQGDAGGGVAGLSAGSVVAVAGDDLTVFPGFRQAVALIVVMRAQQIAGKRLGGAVADFIQGVLDPLTVSGDRLQAFGQVEFVGDLDAFAAAFPGFGHTVAVGVQGVAQRQQSRGAQGVAELADSAGGIAADFGARAVGVFQR